MRSISDIGTSTKLCGIIGNPVGHSMSPAIHNRAFEALGIDYVYLAFGVESVEAIINAMRTMDNFRGLSVTIPHKVAVIPYLDEINEVDAGIGSVNTVINDDGILKGLGTDGPGARKALLANDVILKDKEILVLGSGGAARAVAFDLAYNAAPGGLTLLGVIEDELNTLARDISSKSPITASKAMMNERTVAEAVEKADVIVHATPIGMHPKEEESLVPKKLFHDGLSVMDIVYNPLKTKLLKDAEENGLKTISGLDMFVNQAALQFEAWTGEVAPISLMRDVVLEKLG